MEKEIIYSYFRDTYDSVTIPDGGYSSLIKVLFTDNNQELFAKEVLSKSLEEAENEYEYALFLYTAKLPTPKPLKLQQVQDRFFIFYEKITQSRYRLSNVEPLFFMDNIEVSSHSEYGIHLAETLRKMHKLPLPPDGSNLSKKMARWMSSLLNKLEKETEPLPDYLMPYYANLKSFDLSRMLESEVCCLHGDFHAGNVMGEFIIDLPRSDGYYGCPYWDFTYLMWGMDRYPVVVNAVLNAYFKGSVPNSFWDVVYAMMSWYILNAYRLKRPWSEMLVPDAIRFSESTNQLSAPHRSYENTYRANPLTRLKNCCVFQFEKINRKLSTGGYNLKRFKRRFVFREIMKTVKSKLRQRLNKRDDRCIAVNRKLGEIGFFGGEKKQCDELMIPPTAGKLQRKVLFICSNLVSIPNLIALRHSSFKDAYSVLLLDSKDVSSETSRARYVKQFVKRGIFDDVLVLDIRKSSLLWKIKKSNQPPEKVLTAYIDQQLERFQHNLEMFQDVVLPINNQSYMISLYLHYKEKKFYSLEHSPSRHYTAAKDTKELDKLDESVSNAVKEKNAWNLTNSHFAIPIYDSKTPHEHLLPAPFHIKFDCGNELGLLNVNLKDNILQSFDFHFDKEAFRSKKTAILFGSSFYIDNRVSNETLRDIHDRYLESVIGKNSELKLVVVNALLQIAIDYFFSEDLEVYIKYHPSEFQTEHRLEIFPETTRFTDVFGDFLAFDSNYLSHTWDATLGFKLYSNFTSANPTDIRLNSHFYKIAFYLNKLYFGLACLDLRLYDEIVYEHADLLSPFISKFHPDFLRFFSKRIGSGMNKLIIIQEVDREFTGEASVYSQGQSTYLILNSAETPNLPGFVTQEFVISKTATREQGRLQNIAEEVFYIIAKEELSVPTEYRERALLRSGLFLTLFKRGN